MTRGAARQLLGGVLVFVLALAALAGWRWWHNRPPYGPEALGLTSSLRVVGADEARAALGAAQRVPVANPGDLLVLGQVAWQPPPEPLSGGWFTILLVDKGTGTLPASYGLTEDQPAGIVVGADGVQYRVAERYPWLLGAGVRGNGGGGWTSNGNALMVYRADAAPLTFAAHFPSAAQTKAPAEVSDLLLAMVYVGSDRQVYWAQRLQG